MINDEKNDNGDRMMMRMVMTTVTMTVTTMTNTTMMTFTTADMMIRTVTMPTVVKIILKLSIVNPRCISNNNRGYRT